jgi:chain length determinant protein tyrosine kinase EpsG
LVPANVVTASAGTALKRGDRTIGGILIDAGRLKFEDAERILQLQRDENLLFGDAGIKLGLLTEADIQFALSRQFNYPCLVRGESKVSEDVISAYVRSGPALEALRALRSQLLLRWFDSNPAHKALTIVSGQRREGRSYIAANLAVMFSQLGKRTLLVDADMRNPCQHVLFGLENGWGLSEALSDRGGVTVKHVPGLPDLWVLPAGAPPPNSLELLARPQFPQLLSELKQRFEVILLDSPAATDYADAQTLAVRAGAALIVVRRNATRVWQVRGVSDLVAQGTTTVIGTVLNDF